MAENELKDSDKYLVDVIVRPGNRIMVTIDSFRGIAIDDCVQLSRLLEAGLDRDAEDFELEVSSPGLEQPFKVLRQYEKNLGRRVSVLLRDGRKLEGRLAEATENGIVLEQQKKIKTPGVKTGQLITERNSFRFDQIKETRIVISFN